MKNKIVIILPNEERKTYDGIIVKTNLTLHKFEKAYNAIKREYKK